MSNLYNDWLEAKEAERVAKELRMTIEDQIQKTDPDSAGFKVKITPRMNVKVNADLLQELATEAGLSEHLSSLFRWKPEINQKDWKAADKSITEPLLDAITSTPGRASFKIERVEEEKN